MSGVEPTERTTNNALNNNMPWNRPPSQQGGEGVGYPKMPLAGLSLKAGSNPAERTQFSGVSFTTFESHPEHTLGIFTGTIQTQVGLSVNQSVID